jgi:predicted nucleic acid-binding Zn ribbon protein
MGSKKKELTNYEKRRLRTQQILFIVVGVVVILSMVISLVTNF